MSPGLLQRGSQFAGRYEVLRCIGQGGMGAVYEVLHRETQRKRALKILLPMLVSDAAARARFAQEASITADIDSEHIVESFDAGVDRESGCPFIVMELLRGETLGQRLAQKQRHSAQDVVEMLRQIALVLEQTHRRGIIHRDLKPDNLFLARREDGSCRIKVLDFGIAKVLEQAALSRNTVNIGTPLYMAPEQLDGSRLGPATDLFALTHIAFELLTGESYWEEEVRTSPSTMVLLKLMEKGAPEPARVRAARLGVRVGLEFDVWFARGTAANTAARFGSARELVEMFGRAIDCPLGSMEVGRLSLTGLVPAAAPTPEPAPRSSPTGALDSYDAPTVQRAAPNGLRRSAGPFVTPVGGPRKKPTPFLVWMGVGGLAAMALVAVVATVATQGKATAGQGKDAEVVAEVKAEAVEATATAASAPALITSTSVSGMVAASAKSSAPRTTAVTGRALPTVKTTRPRPTNDRNAGVDCRKYPERCRD